MLKRLNRRNRRSDSENERLISESSSSTNLLEKDSFPFSKDLKVSKLKLSNKNFQNNLQDKPNKLDTTEAYPNDYELALFASKAYHKFEKKHSHDDYEKQLDLPEGWKLLTTASNDDSTNGYFGVAYWHLNRQQVVIAHRGTADKEGFYTDVKGVFLNYNVAQMSSAVTFADMVNQAIYKLNEQAEINFQLSFTGHSLGGWLAQITTFTTEYLVKTEELIFLKNANTLGGCHAHTVVFDSPGCKDMLSKVRDSYDVRYFSRSIVLDSLDITSYLSAPNLVNTCNIHVGSIYRIFPVSPKPKTLPEKLSRYAVKVIQGGGILDEAFELLFEYTIETHDKKKILGVFDPLTGQVNEHESGKPGILTVEDWPRGTGLRIRDEFGDFFKLAEHSNDYHLEITDNNFKQKGYYTIRYKTQPFDEKTNNLRIFSKSERLFLESWMILKQHEVRLTELEAFLLTKLGKRQGKIKFQKIKGSLKHVSLDTKENRIKSKNEKVKDVIHYVKQLLREFPEVLPKIMAQVSGNTTVSKAMYQAKSTEYLNALHAFKEWVKFNDKLGDLELKKFITNSEQRGLLLVTQANTDFEAARVYNILKQIQETQKYTFLALEQMVALEQFLYVEEIFSHIDSNLLVIESRTQEVGDKATELLGKLCRKLEEEKYIDKKIVIIVPEQDDGNKAIEKIYSQFQDNKNKFEQTRTIHVSDVRFSNLKSESQNELKVNFQGKQIPLVELVNDKDKLNELIEPEILIELMTKEPIAIDSKPLRLSDLEAAYAKRSSDEPIESQNLLDALLENSVIPTLFMISGIKQENIGDAKAKKNEFINLLKIKDKKRIEKIKHQTCFIEDTSPDKRIIIVTGQNKESEFKKLCRDNPNKTIHWVEITNGQFFLQQLYDPKFYVERKLKKVAVKEALKAHLLKPNPTDLLVFSGLDEKSLYQLLKVTKDEDKKKIEKKIKEKHLFIFSEYPEAESEFKQQIRDKQTKSVYWLKSEGNNQQLVKELPSDDPSVTQESEFSLVSNDKLVVIVDKPGMGKSTTLMQLTEKNIDKSWVIRLNLKDCQQALNGLPEQQPNLEQVVNFLAAGGKLDNTLATGLLGYHLASTTAKSIRPLLVLLDAFDEIQGVNYERKKQEQEKVIQLLNFLNEKSSAKVWLTTRHDPELEEKLDILFTTEFEPFDEDNQTEFLWEFWKERTQLLFNQKHRDKIFGITRDDKTTKFSRYAKALLGQAKKVLGEETAEAARFMGIPLQMRLLAEVFLEKFEQFSKLPEDTLPESDNLLESYFVGFKNVVDIYQFFIEAKYEIFFKEKTRLSEGLNEVTKKWMKEVLTKRHRRLGFYEVLPEETTALLEVKLPFDKKDEAKQLKVNHSELEELYRIGLVQKTRGKDQVEFIHHTFAEYFTADLLSSWLNRTSGRSKNPQLQKFLLTKILIQSDYQAIRAFLNGQLAKNSPSDSTLTEYGKSIDELWSKGSLHNPYGSTTLHVAAEAGNHAIIDLLANSLRKGHSKTLEDLLVATNDLLINSIDFKNQTALLVAAKNGHGEVVKKLLNLVKEICHEKILQVMGYPSVRNRNRREKETALHWAAKFGHGEVVQNLLDSVKHDLDTLKNLVMKHNGENKTALHLAAENGHGEVVQELLNIVNKNLEGNYQGISAKLVAYSDKGGKTALHLAAENGHGEVVHELLDFVNKNLEENCPGTLKCLVEGLRIHGRTALHLAAKNSHNKVVQQILDFAKEHLPKSFNALNDIYREYRLRKAASIGDIDTVKQLLKEVAEDSVTLNVLVSATNERGQTALHCAAENGNVEVAQKLLDSVKHDLETLKAMVMLTTPFVGHNYNRDDRTALQLAAENGHGEVVQELLDFVNKNLEENYTGTLKAMVEFHKNDGQTALLRAAKNSHNKVVQQLLVFVKKNLEGEYPGTLKALVVTPDRYDKTALHLAAENGHSEVVQELLDFVNKNLEGEYPGTLKALVVTPDRYDKTALHLAAENGHGEVVQELLDFVNKNLEENYPGTLKALVEAPKNDGQTALHLAAKNSHNKVVQQLLVFVKKNFEGEYPGTLKALVVTSDRHDKTALHLAAENGHSEVVQELLDFVNKNLEENYPGTLKALLEVPQNDGQTVLHLAAKNSHNKVVQQLLSFVKEHLSEAFDALNDIYRACRLRKAASAGQIYTIEQLLKEVADDSGTLNALVRATDEDGRTALHCAAQEGSWRIAVSLLNAGANINDLSDEQCDSLRNHIRDNNYENEEQIIQLIERRLVSTYVPKFLDQSF